MLGNSPFSIKSQEPVTLDHTHSLSDLFKLLLSVLTVIYTTSLTLFSYQKDFPLEASRDQP